ncbi:glycoside hydrolase family 2 TIM barrel-domain containing protein [Winogradskyella sp. SYSU M77433]|uniref:glycoside hydrolase family 2 TIM barrel-domain containing protein n=1 Tax=Winogradskyella sp. SYSU M77433 TaxID=3042722 RepID=UPI0024816609|nr:glycoside hydrolase family 2 TIM barrel-domain containing protein [Winogradskyella sp. SYSU M77433]MDH7911597.1 glycoside hydrolase family 2 TIM barrel-domain containing protein [Winogradskyella sp. SYSU M77433]
MYLFFYVAFPFLCFSQSKTINYGWQYSENKTHWQTVNIPHTWNAKDAFDDEAGYRRGLGFYEKQIFVSSKEKEQIFYLKFNAVNQEATVYVNGKKITNHKGGYTAFNVEITSFLKFDAYNLIEVEVDNSHNDNIPPLDADFTFYGGIYRDVELIKVPKQHFSLKDFASDGFYVNYYNVSNEKAGVKVKVLIDNFEDKTNTYLELKIFDADGNLIREEHQGLKLKGHETKTVEVTFPEIKNPKLWSPDNPCLYKLQLTLSDKNGTVLDQKLSNLGFRWTTVDAEKGFFLNGKPIKLIGVNRHQDYKNYGNAVPIELQKRDIHLIKNMGTNVIRFAHYPHARELYELCDKLGILVWTEIPIVNKVTDSETFFEVSNTMQNEHIKQYYNYPSVVMLGYMNEIFLRLAFDRKSTEEEKKALKTTTLKLAKQLENLTRSLAPNHITVMACHLNEVYNETGIANLPMLLGWNLYFGWYDAQIEDLGKFLDDQHQRYPKRSLLLSEYGPGADVRIFTKTPKKFDFSTNYQAKLHQSYYKQITNRLFMTGMTAWNFADFGSEFRGDAIPHVNQKGLVQYDRTPKDIYYWYKSVLDEGVPFIYIVTDNLKGLTVFEEEAFPVQIYSNQNEVNVSLNGNNLGDFKVDNGVVSIDMPFTNGNNSIAVSTESISEEKTIKVNRIEAFDFKNFKRFGINLGAHFNFYDEAQNIIFVPDQEYKKEWFGYKNGSALGMTKDKNQGLPHNIKNTDAEPLFQTLLEGCTEYQLDVPEGNYNVKLYFVEPQIKSTENIYNLSEQSSESNKIQRIFDVYINDGLIEKQLNLAQAYPEKYGVTLQAIIQTKKGLTLKLNAIEGLPVISGILIEKID